MAIKNFFIKSIKNTGGDAVVQAAILFPIMVMIFAGLVLLSVYLPTRSALQRATQHAATVIAAEMSDTWLFFDENKMKYYWASEKSALENVYVSFYRSVIPGKDNQKKADIIVRHGEGGSLSIKFEGDKNNLDVNIGVVNYFIYKEIIVTATRKITMPVNLSFVKFPKEITITATSTAVVQNGDEFLRNMDLAVDFVEFISEKLGLSKVSEAFDSFGGTVSKILGWG